MTDEEKTDVSLSEYEQEITDMVAHFVKTNRVSAIVRYIVNMEKTRRNNQDVLLNILADVTRLRDENENLLKGAQAIYAAPSRSNAKRVMAQMGIPRSAIAPPIDTFPATAIVQEVKVAQISSELFPHSSEILITCEDDD